MEPKFDGQKIGRSDASTANELFAGTLIEDPNPVKTSFKLEATAM